MRIVGIILVVLGALSLGWRGFTVVRSERLGGETIRWGVEKESTIWVSPLVGGIAVVSGLILLASRTHQEDA